MRRPRKGTSRNALIKVLLKAENISTGVIVLIAVAVPFLF
jgi:hypothetical protein